MRHDGARYRLATPAWAQTAKKPSILVTWGDDIGQFNISAYNMGMMGCKTPHIDRIATEGATFTNWCGQQGCTAGRAAFVTGQSPIRTGLTKVGLPGAPEGMKKEDPTIATLLRAQGCMTGQFGKDPLGDRDDMLPTAHGFDEFFGHLYHLNAEEEPENADEEVTTKALDFMERAKKAGKPFFLWWNSIDMCSTDKGAETLTWPDSSTTLFRGE